MMKLIIKKTKGENGENILHGKVFKKYIVVKKNRKKIPIRNTKKKPLIIKGKKQIGNKIKKIIVINKNKSTGKKKNKKIIIIKKTKAEKTQKPKKTKAEKTQKPKMMKVEKTQKPKMMKVEKTQEPKMMKVEETQKPKMMKVEETQKPKMMKVEETQKPKMTKAEQREYNKGLCKALQRNNAKNVSKYFSLGGSLAYGNYDGLNSAAELNNIKAIKVLFEEFDASKFMTKEMVKELIYIAEDPELQFDNLVKYLKSKVDSLPDKIENLNMNGFEAGED